MRPKKNPRQVQRRRRGRGSQRQGPGAGRAGIKPRGPAQGPARRKEGSGHVWALTHPNVHTCAGAQGEGGSQEGPGSGLAEPGRARKGQPAQ